MRRLTILNALFTWCGRMASIAWAENYKFFNTRNLLTTDTFAEINIHVLPDFSRKVYISKLQGDPQSLAKVVESIVRAGTDIGAQHGVSLNLALPLSAVNAQGQWVKDTPTPVGITLQFQPPQERKA